MSEPDDDFERAAAGGNKGLLSDVWGFLSDNKKWWLMPIIVVLLLLGVVVVVGGTSAAPFIYSLF
jgi:hypothetical protein